LTRVVTKMRETVKNRISRRVLIVLYFALFGSYAAFAQEDKEKWDEGEIQSVEIEIVKDRQISLPKANRNFEKIPPRAAEPIKPEITYDLKSFTFNSPDYSPSIRPLKLKQEELAKIYGNYLSAGLGNYSSPYAELYLNSKRDKNKFYGAHFYHNSFGKGPVDGKNSASGNTNVDLFGKFFTDAVTTSAFLNYDKRTGYFYGYPQNGPEVDRKDIKQDYNVVSLGAELENSKLSDFNFKLSGGFSYLQDYYDAKESEVSVGWKSDYKISDKSALIFNANYFLIARKDLLVDAKPRNLLKFNPAYRFYPVENLRLTIGLNAVAESDKIANKNLHVYPDVWANYELAKSVEAYAGLTGDIDKVSLHTLSAENFWLNSNIDIAHTSRSADFRVGLKGKVIKKLAFDAGFSVANLKNLYFYQNDATDPSKFIVVYDAGSTQRLNLFADLGINFADKARLNLRGDYFGYSTDKQAEAWHRPTYRMAFNSYFNIYSKLTLHIDFITQGGMKALDVVNNKTVTLNPAVDLNAKLNYFVSKRFSVFLKFNNMLSNKYPVYFNYPVRGFQAMGGINWSF
jgi:hypothetical protein